PRRAALRRLRLRPAGHHQRHPRPVREIPELPAHFARQSAVEDGGTRRDAQQRAGGAEARRIGSAPASLRTTPKNRYEAGRPTVANSSIEIEAIRLPRQPSALCSDWPVTRMTRASRLAHALAHARFAPRQEGEQSAGAQSIQNQARQSAGLRRGSSMAEAIPALEIRNLHKRYGDLEVLKGISLTARDGDVISILGSSGSGKSTFLRCINLLENPHEGEILVGGEQLKLKRAKDGDLVAADARQINR